MESGQALIARTPSLRFIFVFLELACRRGFSRTAYIPGLSCIYYRLLLLRKKRKNIEYNHIKSAARSQLQ